MSSDVKIGAPIDLGLPTQDALLRLEKEILQSPKVLEAGISTIIDRYACDKTDQGLIITPDCPITFTIAEETIEAVAFAGIDETNYSRHVIYQKNVETEVVSEWLIFERGPITKISDGEGRSLVEESDLAFVRQILDAMKAGYEERVISKADSFDLNNYLAETIAAEIEARESALAALRTHAIQLDEARTKPVTQFRIILRSGWEYDGEKSLDEIITADSLSEALQLATQKFKAMNGRSDVQASLTVEVCLGENSWEVPSEVVNPLFVSLARWDKETTVVANSFEELREL